MLLRRAGYRFEKRSFARVGNVCFSKLAGGRHTQTQVTAKRNGSQVSMQRTQEDKSARVVSMQNSWLRNLRGQEWLQGPRSLDWFTGKPPLHGICPGVGQDGFIRSLPMPNLNQVTRQQTQEYFDNTWTLFETMFAGLTGEETFYRPPVHGLRHPQIFYYGHTVCLYVNKLRVAGIISDAVDPFLESVLEVGVDEMLWDDMRQFGDDWPTVRQVYEYRQKVYSMICKVIAEHPSLEDYGGTRPVRVTQDDPIWALFMGFEHERIHLETSSVLFREMPQHLVQQPMGWPPIYPGPKMSPPTPTAGVDYPVNQMLPVKGGQATLGKPKYFPAYGWDNEYGEREMKVGDFEASKYLISNGEFLEFVQEGGYAKEDYWCASGWKWRKFRNMKWPFFWVPDGPEGSNLFKLRTIFETVSMRWNHPVDVNYYESRAFCRWKAMKEGQPTTTYRLITEAEHHFIRPDPNNLQAKAMNFDRVMSVGGSTFATPGEEGNANLNLAHGSESPVDAMAPSHSGHFDAMGNVWEWCEDDFNGLDGFAPHPTYLDFSTPCFDGQHNMIMGGSFMSTGNEASGFARFMFRPHFLQHSGFRMVHSKGEVPATKILLETAKKHKNNVYETQQLVNQYLGMHFALKSGEAEGVAAILPHDNAPTQALRFPQRCAELLRALKPQHTNGRALDVGCAVGGTAFELATTFDEVVAIDFSQAFIDSAKRMQSGQKVRFGLATEGELVTELVAVHESHITDQTRARVVFQHGNACALAPQTLGGAKFDAIVVANLICRVPEPLACLDGLSACTNSGGVVLLCTPFSWLEEHTPRSNWLGGYTNAAGEAVYSKDRLRMEMEKRGFTKIHEEQMPALIREHQRKYQYIVSEATGWRRL